MFGLLAIYAFDELWTLSTYVKYGLMALQHRGAEKYVICVANGNVSCYSSKNMDEVVDKASSNRVIGATYADNDEHLYRETIDGFDVALLAERAHSVFDDLVRGIGRAMKSGSTNDIVAAFNLYSNVDGIPSFVAISSNGEVLAWRSPGGLTPMVLGGYGFDMAIISSESTAIDILDADIRRFVAPGEGFYISRYLLKNFRVETSVKSRLCLFELLYLARHDAVIDGVSVYEFRKRLGEELARVFDKDVDIAVGVPETALPYAIGFSNAIGRPFELAFVATGGRARSMLKFDPREKIVAIHLKMNPIRSSLEGKKIALVDDSMVTGSTVKTVSQILRYRIGVNEIHLLIASPPLISPCPYGVLKLGTENLLAANLTKEMAEKYLEVDSLHWLSIESIDRVAKMFRLNLCGRCFGVHFFG
ncbi:MAG: amidophosphoribosyltransferase [Ignisphaera sp.]|uniref:Amidophosphoribosyltransferase n=1 Tax=Ignisphaera aggregans TaxID=334771 RepID=A0A7J3JRR7_9CREN